ncbi:MAG: TolC family protein, partial [Proteobacteria bacterium]|nr:TolC family protein [Pseudomonadota bacterium]
MKQMYWESKTFISLPLLCLLAFVVPGCTVGPDFQTPDISGLMQDEWQETDHDSGRFDNARQPESEWWQQFHDDQLSALINRLGSSSLALAQARERIVEVTARQGVIGADKRLQLAAALGYTHAETGDEAVSMLGLQPGKSLDVYSAGVVAGWELDVWGRTTRLLEAGEEDIRAGYADLQGMMVSLAAELTLAYIEARTVEARLDKLRENIELQRKTLDLAKSRLEAGNGSALEVVRTERLLSTTRSRLPELARSLTVAQNHIKVLL